MTDTSILNSELANKTEEEIQARQALIESHLGLVHHMARHMARALGGTVELDDLVSFGTIGLIAAVDRFEVERGLSFSTFAAPRIRGAILDEIRKQDHIPRTLRKKERDLARAREALEAKLGRSASAAELGEVLNLPVETVWQWEGDVEQSKLIRIDNDSGDEEESRTSIGFDMIADDRFGDVEDFLTKEREVELLREAIMNLKEQERVVLSLYYFEELTLSQIASIIEVSESRVSQIRAKSLVKLRESMGSLRSAVA